MEKEQRLKELEAAIIKTELEIKLLKEKMSFATHAEKNQKMQLLQSLYEEYDNLSADNNQNG
ncbi:MAG: hypothetical protein JST90_15970 [Bacteroidetes bacterium]|nr:hypothetical protein [Bacteroidota bacterium]